MRVFLDANLIFSAAQTGSSSRQLIETLARHATLTTHPAVWHETERNLHAKRPDWLAGLASLKPLLHLHSGVAACPDVGLPAKDQPVLAAAIAARADRLVTGDRAHFGLLFEKTIQGVRIVSTQMMAEEMQANGWI